MNGAPTPLREVLGWRRIKLTASVNRARTANIGPRMEVPDAMTPRANALAATRPNPSPHERIVNPVPVVPWKALREDCGCFEKDEDTETETIN